MIDNAFDAAGFIKVDLETGTISSPLQTPLALVPLSVLQTLTPTSAGKDASVNWGKERGEVLASTLNVEIATMDVLAQHVQGEIALMGMGRASIDVFGDALLIKITGGTPAAAASPVVSAILEGFSAGYISAVSKKEFDALTIEHGADVRVLFVGHVDTTARVKSLLAAGIAPLVALEKLHKEVA